MENVIFSGVAATENFARLEVSKASIKHWPCLLSSEGDSAPPYVKVSAAVVFGAWQGGTFHNNEMTLT